MFLMLLQVTSTFPAYTIIIPIHEIILSRLIIIEHSKIEHETKQEQIVHHHHHQTRTTSVLPIA